MKSLCVFEMPNPQLNRRVLVRLFLLVSFFAGIAELHAQQNPTGVSGIFNGQITTGCSYDPWTTNAMRGPIVDIAVAGAVGEYPLALTRTNNSRGVSTTGVFGQSGGWNHSYNWILEDSETASYNYFLPSAYTVEFPDGRVETFKYVTWDTAPPCTTNPGMH